LIGSSRADDASPASGISGSGRAQLAAVAGRRRFIVPEDAAAELHVNPQVAARKLAHWAEKGWLRRVKRGLYIPVPVEAEQPDAWSQDALIVAERVWRPCYFTGWTSANHWGLTEQVFRTVVVKTAQRVRTSEAALLDTDYLLTHVSDDAMQWGLASVWHEDVRLKIADPARTVIDVLDEPRLAGGIRHVTEVLSAYLEEHDPRKLIEYADRLENRAIVKRLGYLTEVLGVHQSELLDECRSRLSSGIALLDPRAGQNGRRSPAWRLRLNVHVAREEPS
jgi:predicted transcriptional regulator of viral defense system